MIGVLIADDEALARRALREDLETLADLKFIGEAEDGEDALTAMCTLRPDLLFLDLQMPSMSGFDVIRSLSGSALPWIVVLTEYDSSILATLEAAGIEYVLKPANETSLKRAVEQARRMQSKKLELVQAAARLVEALTAKNGARVRKVIGRNAGEYFLLDVDEIIAFHADRGAVWIVTAQKRYLAAEALRNLDVLLRDTAFQRVDRGVIVNVDHVREIRPMSGQRSLLRLTNADELIVSKQQAEGLRHRLRL